MPEENPNDKVIISFTVYRYQKEELTEIAIKKGFHKAGNFARYTVFNYITRNKLSFPRRASAVKSEKGNTDI